MKKSPILFVVALLLTVGCREEAPGESTTTATGTAAGLATDTRAEIHPSDTAAPPGPLDVETTGGTTVLVVLEDTTVGMPSTEIPPGPASFTVTNSGTEIHDLRLEGGQGIAVEIEGTLEPGQSKTMQADLRPGSYEVYCPILDHRDRGQRAQFTIAQ